jgi:hypothetical protein
MTFLMFNCENFDFDDQHVADIGLLIKRIRMFRAMLCMFLTREILRVIGTVLPVNYAVVHLHNE